MRLYEFQAKRIFKGNGIPVPKGKLATCASEVEGMAKEIGGAVVIKAQVLIGGRGLAGGVKFADNSSTPACAIKNASRLSFSVSSLTGI